MYIHVGGDIILPINRIVGIFPYVEEALPKDTLAFLENQTIQKNVYRQCNRRDQKRHCNKSSCVLLSGFHTNPL